MSLPYIKKCPCCGSINFVRIGGISGKHSFKGLSKYVLKKKFSCRICKEEIGLFSDQLNVEKLIWLNDYKCEENYYNQLNKLNERKSRLIKNLNGSTRKLKINKKIIEEKYSKTLSEIKDIQKKIYLDKIKLKIKLKIQKRPGIISQI